MGARVGWGTYRRVADALRGRVAGGGVLPSEAAIGQECGVSRTTVRRALGVLESERLIRSRPGVGWVAVTPQGQGAPSARSIAADLRGQITSGELVPGVALPSEAALVRQYGVSRGTVRAALSELEGSGLVVAVHGKGRFVRSR